MPAPVYYDLCGTETYSYDTNPYDATYSQNAIGRRTAVQWGGANCPLVNGAGPANGGILFTEMYTYNAAGQMTGTQLRILRNGNTTDLNSSYTYDNEGRMITETFPTGTTYTYTFDTMGRPTGLKDSQNGTWILGGLYNAANQLTQLTYGAGTERRQYNSMNQMTTQSYPGVMGMQYTYTAGQNNGQASQITDTVTGEQIAYVYDSLKRLYSATASASGLGPGWGESFGYDGFGNLTDKNNTGGTAPTFHVSVGATTNQYTSAGYAYDANGNMTTGGGLSNAIYDTENRLLISNVSGGERYMYGPDNKRMWKIRADGSEEIYFYGARGEKLASYQPASPGSATLTLVTWHLYLAGELRFTNGHAVVRDRLGSVRMSYAVNAASRYYAYGEEYTTTAQGREKFGTYYRDGTTGLDYADQRYYASTLGRFMTPDSFAGSASPVNPLSWNRYAYALGDPVNANDPTGRCFLEISTNLTGPQNAYCDPGSSSSMAPISGLSNQAVITDGFGGEMANSAASFDYSFNTAFYKNYLDMYLDPKRIAAQIQEQAAAIKKAVGDRLGQLNVSAADIEEIQTRLTFSDIVGGHMNLGINETALRQLLPNVDPLSLTDGWPNGDRTGGLWSLFYSLHSEFDQTNDIINFHIDTFNLFGYVPIGALGHFMYDVVWGHVVGAGGQDCIDLACPAAK